MSTCKGLALAALLSAAPLSAQSTRIASVAPACEQLASLTLTNAVVTLARAYPAGDFRSGRTFQVPAFCRIAITATPTADSDIKVEVWLPETWNGKLLGTDNGGFSGAINYAGLAGAVTNGYAAVSTDTGHSGDQMDFGIGHPEKIVDWAHRAVHEMTTIAKTVVEKARGRAPRYSYFTGCSTGGQQALSEAQRYPADYDGIVAGAPGNNRIPLIYGFLWSWLATHDASGKATLPASKLPALGKAVMAACDKNDGVEDGVIGDPRRCHFDPAALACAGAETDACLTSPQIEAARKVYAGARARDGRQLYPGWARGSESGWGQYIISPAAPVRVGLFRDWVFKDPSWDPRRFDWDKDVATVDAAFPVLNAMSRDYAAFSARGGKLIMYTGLADPVVSPLDTFEYYDSVVTANGGLEATRRFFRFFPVPGMAHCRGGAGTSTFDALAALEAWVERGIAPETIPASRSSSGRVDRTRPLCAYPAAARYTGSGSIDDAANFSCVAAEAPRVPGPAQAAVPPDIRPNVVVVLVDDMGWSDIGPFGSEIATPSLDALARRGVRFTQFYATPRCSPTRASLLTGLYSHQAGMGHLDNVVRRGSVGTTGRLNDRSVTMAEVLRDAGYFTAMSGKWHLGQDNGSPPWDRGFERTLSLRAGGMFFPNQNYTGGDNPLASRAQEPLFLNGVATPRDAPVFGSSWYATYLWTDFGLKFVDEARQANKPFFLYLPFNAPHFPLMAPAELIARYRGKYRAGWDRMRQERYRRQVRLGLIDAKWPLSPREPDTPAWDSLSDREKDRFDHLMAVYAAMVEAIDTAVGTLVKGLEARGVLDNTLILFMSDNGANAESGPGGRFNGDPPGGPNSDLYLGMNWAAVGSTPFRRFKHFTHEGGISSPLIVSWPRGIAASRRGAIERQPAHVIDIMATVTAATGAAYSSEYKGRAIQPMEGIDLRAALDGRPLNRPRPLFWEHEGNRAARSGKWKVVSLYQEAWELYDIAADRVERNNLAARHPDIVKRLSDEWDAWAKRTNVDPWPGPARLPWGDNAPARGGRQGRGRE